MNERVPDSSGLPLRAMVMVLLFLGVIFLLLGWQALGSSGKADEDSSSVSTASSSASPTSTSAKPAADAEVRVYNISSKEGIAKSTADELKAAGFKVTDVTNLSVSDVSATTVYYGEDSEKATAEAVGKKLGAPVEKRIPALADQPPGVIVLVMG
ncbi:MULTISPECIES: LytR C-terminal domain-containing protein [Mycobacterium]|uniref:LytR/CpsA/Psr regulator C-terminal domain-containing protein n=1 Tax=Mycobacterium kiyosense TaxID=2871094 RepID=A0A9P3Q3J0_9MYCO|nr:MULTISPECIES: LytR C-terminal domain-containing protein [Mycobacterium]BDB40304.1 hypothetical protein IWGMT90018_07500 [Mycobacterium kiyosense]BDE12126.1 hypothetical protein MKCMC460_09860 [Mycobacterium sp. 20KCMC460]GLB83849.1 hypothetical protein SRL2020028_31050 [Mycobacterium kiyosense]GLB88719.1 hypothetical protein SRL2020130_15360 [Mycobacterium kiyosense]GLB95011.1 hypothetical protein SRL2020226_17870 [Mycobacterium kiyosense]